MSEIDRDGPFKVIIYPNDHEPSHVHVWHPSGVVVVNLTGDSGAPEIRNVGKNVKTNDAKRAYQLVVEKQDLYMDAWRAIHGDAEDE